MKARLGSLVCSKYLTSNETPLGAAEHHISRLTKGARGQTQGRGPGTAHRIKPRRDGAVLEHSLGGIRRRTSKDLQKFPPFHRFFILSKRYQPTLSLHSINLPVIVVPAGMHHPFRVNVHLGNANFCGLAINIGVPREQLEVLWMYSTCMYIHRFPTHILVQAGDGWMDG